MNRLRKIITVILIIAILNVFTSGVFAETLLEDNAAGFDDELLSRNFFWGRESMLRGVFQTARMYFTVSDYWKVRNAEVNLQLSQSELLDTASSTLTLYLNEKPFHSMLLKDAVVHNKVVKVNVPLDYLNSGSNELRVEAYRRISDKPCTDDVNQANWLTVHSKSYVHIKYNEKRAAHLISEFPYPFLRSSDTSASSKSLILLPDSPDNEEYAAALLMASVLGSLNKDGYTDINTARYSQMDTAAKENHDIIFIGKKDKIPAEFLEIIGRSQLEELGDSALIIEGKSPFNEKREMLCLVAGKESGMLETGVKLLFNTDMVKQINTDRFKLEKGLDISIEEVEVKEQMSFKDIGYNTGIMLKGPFRQEAIVGIKLPKNRQVMSNAKIHLNIRYSKNLDFKRSLATVYINGIAIGSKNLELITADSDAFELNIPYNTVKTNYMEIKLAFDLEIQTEACALRQEEMPWAYVSEDSYLKLPTKPEAADLLEYYPWPFVKDGRLNDVNVVIPDILTPEETDMLFDMFGYIGGEVSSNRGRLKVINASAFSEADKDANILVLGSPKDVKLLREINNSQWFRYDDGFILFVSNEKRKLIESYSKELAAIQLFTSPFKSGFKVMTVSAPNRANILRLKKYLAPFQSGAAIVGNASLVDGRGNLLNHYFINQDSGRPSIYDKLNLGGNNTKIFIAVFVLILILLIVSMVLYIKKYRRR